MDFKFKLGQKAKDVVTGAGGTITGYAGYITGCNQYLIQPSIKRGETKIPDSFWMDEDRLKLVDKTPIKLEPKRYNGPGEPAPKK